MEVSTKLFNAQATKNFSKINEQIQDTQAKIASGKSFLKASDDPVTASNLSAKREQKILLERFIKNGNTAKTRLDLADYQFKLQTIPTVSMIDWQWLKKWKSLLLLFLR